VRIAWFSPLPPTLSGIAAYSAEVLPLLRSRRLEIDTFSEGNAHDFVWRHRRQSYDLTVFHLGNAACHDYMWGYLFRYPGVVVLHDAQLHQARALALTRRWQPRRDDYLAEFRANHPEAPEDLGELVTIGGMGGTLFQHWPHIRLVVESARMIVVHNQRLAADLRETYPSANIHAIQMGVADPLARSDVRSPQTSSGRPAHLRPEFASSAEASAEAEDPPPQRSVRARHGIPQNAIVLAAFGGITPEKRVPEILRASSAIARHRSDLHVMVVGNPAAHYDVMADARAWRMADRVHVTGFVPDDQLADYLLAADICACLRWPTNRETSASWLRCLAAARTTLITDLAQLGDVPTLDPRGWRPRSVDSQTHEPVAISIDLLDEDHSLQLAFERLCSDSHLRSQLGRAARKWWQAHHRLEPMSDAYIRLLTAAVTTPAPRTPLPAHLTDDGSARAAALFDELGISRGRDLFEVEAS
jgi:glycosyltransferase involved in cell wall biosynthesis